MNITHDIVNTLKCYVYVCTDPRNGAPFDIGKGQAGTLPYKTLDAEGFKKSGRWEFEGVIATEVRDEYIGNSVGLGEQNPIRYKNI